MTGTSEMENNIFGIERKKALTELLHACVNEICGHPGPKFQNYSEDWKEKDFNFLYESFMELLKNPTSINLLDKEKIPEEYNEFPDFLKSLILTCMKVRKEQLVEALVRDGSRYDNPLVHDFDWKVKYIMGSSKMASIRTALLQLDFILNKENPEHLLQLELNKSELTNLIEALESLSN